MYCFSKTKVQNDTACETNVNNIMMQKVINFETQQTLQLHISVH